MRSHLLLARRRTWFATRWSPSAGCLVLLPFAIQDFPTAFFVEALAFAIVPATTLAVARAWTRRVSPGRLMEELYLAPGALRGSAADLEDMIERRMQPVFGAAIAFHLIAVLRVNTGPVGIGPMPPKFLALILAGASSAFHLGALRSYVRSGVESGLGVAAREAFARNAPTVGSLLFVTAGPWYVAIPLGLFLMVGTRGAILALVGAACLAACVVAILRGRRSFKPEAGIVSEALLDHPLPALVERTRESGGRATPPPFVPPAG